MTNIVEHGHITYRVEWESKFEPDVWLGGFLLKRYTYEDAVALYKERMASRPELNWRMTRHTVITTIEVVEL